MFSTGISTMWTDGAIAHAMSRLACGFLGTAILRTRVSVGLTRAPNRRSAEASLYWRAAAGAAELPPQRPDEPSGPEASQES
jgi:hypothetical protein